LALALAVSTADSTLAQSRRAGIMAGATYSQLTDDFTSSSNFEWGFIGGGYLEWQYHPQIAGQIEINYVQRGGSGTRASNGDDFDMDLAYLEFPLTFNAMIPVTPTVELRGGIGFTFALSLSCKAAIDSGSKQSCGTTFPGLDKSSIEWSLPFGAGVGFNLGRNKVVLEARYHLGLSNVLKTVNIKNRSWEFMARFGQAIF
jgi:hypothetical protein